MTSLDSVPYEVLYIIGKHVKSALDESGDPTFYNLSYLNDRCRVMTLEIFHSQDFRDWNKKTRQKKMIKMRKAEGLALSKAITQISRSPPGQSKAKNEVIFRERCNKVKGFDRAERVEEGFARAVEDECRKRFSRSASDYYI